MTPPEKKTPAERSPGPKRKDRMGSYAGHFVQRPPVRKPKRKTRRYGR